VPRAGAVLAGPADLEFRLEDDLPVLMAVLTHGLLQPQLGCGAADQLRQTPRLPWP